MTRSDALQSNLMLESDPAVSALSSFGRLPRGPVEKLELLDAGQLYALGLPLRARVSRNTASHHRTDACVHLRDRSFLLLVVVVCHVEDALVGFRRRLESLWRVLLRLFLDELQEAGSTRAAEKMGEVELAIRELPLALTGKAVARFLDHLAGHQGREIRVLAKAENPPLVRRIR